MKIHLMGVGGVGIAHMGTHEDVVVLVDQLLIIGTHLADGFIADEAGHNQSQRKLAYPGDALMHRCLAHRTEAGADAAVVGIVPELAEQFWVKVAANQH